MAGGIGDEAEQLGQRAAEGAAQLKETAQHAGQHAADAAQRAADRLGDARDAAWDVAQKAGADAYRRGERTVREIAGQVEERPLAALLIAGAIGYAIAYLLHARR
ncbi:MAG TPA: hypothetical protein VMA53_28975 [Stellaceae bacterium]|nr:hypothetical protein [Stellaceae bacterium]